MSNSELIKVKNKSHFLSGNTSCGVNIDKAAVEELTTEIVFNT